MVESSDVLFAIDSIPAIFAVTLDPFIVFTSNIFAIMGLRALYFLLASVMGMFVYLKLGISSILAFVGGKMIAGRRAFPVSITVSVTIILIPRWPSPSSLRSCAAETAANRHWRHQKEKSS